MRKYKQILSEKVVKCYFWNENILRMIIGYKKPLTCLIARNCVDAVNIESKNPKNFCLDIQCWIYAVSENMKNLQYEQWPIGILLLPIVIDYSSGFQMEPMRSFTSNTIDIVEYDEIIETQTEWYSMSELPGISFACSICTPLRGLRGNWKANINNIICCDKHKE